MYHYMFSIRKSEGMFDSKYSLDTFYSFPHSEVELYNVFAGMGEADDPVVQKRAQKIVSAIKGMSMRCRFAPETHGLFHFKSAEKLSSDDFVTMINEMSPEELKEWLQDAKFDTSGLL